MSAEYEAIIDANFLPHLGAWYEHKLGSRYEFIEPGSAVGKIAVELHQTLIETAVTQDRSSRYTSELDQLVHADDIEAADLAYAIAEARHKAFEGMYYDMSGMQDTARAGYPISGGYQGAVSAALERGIRELDRVWIPPGSKPELISLNEEIASFLSLESGLHFRILTA